MTDAPLPPFPFGIIMAPMPEPSPEEHRAMWRERYERVRPYMIDQWPQSVAALSFPTKMIPVDVADMEILFDYQHPEWKAKAGALAAVLDEAMDWERHFVRLNNRSPKDAAASLITCAGRQAVDWITTSERCIDDVVMAKGAGSPLFVCLREALHMHPDGEFRCFAKDGKVVAVSRYFHRTEPEHRPEAGTMLAAATRFYDAHLARHYPDVVFDLYAPGSDQEVLIEINPYGMSDPCLFDGYDDVEHGGERLG